MAQTVKHGSSLPEDVANGGAAAGSALLLGATRGRTATTIRASSPRIARGRGWDGRGYFSAIHCVEMMLFAVLLLEIQLMNAEAAPVALPLVTS